MNSFLAVLVLALAVSAQAAYLPLGSGLLGTSLLRTPETWTTLHAPRYLTHFETPRFIETPRLLATEGNYLAATRGSVHTAPLPGHLLSASSINLDSAPGTF